MLLIVVVGVGTGGTSASVASKPRERTATLAEVSDGDTLELRDGTRVRLIGIDTPETQHPEFGDECYGQAATRFARRGIF